MLASFPMGFINYPIKFGCR